VLWSHSQARRAATSTWESVDRELTDNAIWIPTVDTRDVEITSPPLRNYEFNPVWGFLADQAWLAPQHPSRP
jgi:hypothetical protein